MRDNLSHGYLPGCSSLEAKAEPRGWCPSAGDNPESSAPLGARRQEGGSLCFTGGRNIKEKGVA